MIQQQESQSLRNLNTEQKQKAINLLQQNRTQSKCSLFTIITLFIIVIVCCFTSGIYFIIQIYKIIQYRVDYYHGNSDIDVNSNIVKIVNISVNFQFNSPLYIYYQVGYNYQNFVNYVNSRSQKQLAGYYLSQDQILKECYFDQNFNQKQIFSSIQLNYNNQSCNFESSFNNNNTKFNLSNQKVTNPCGYIARTYFNDTFFLFKYLNNNNQKIIYENANTCILNNNTCPIKCSNICNPSQIINSTILNFTTQFANNDDCKFSFVNCCNYSTDVFSPITIYEQSIISLGDPLRDYYKNNINQTNQGNAQWANKQNQHFIQWMSNSGLPNKPILWGKIDPDISFATQQVITVVIFLNHDSSLYDGYRSIIISNSLRPKFALTLIAAASFFMLLTSIIGLIIFCKKIFIKAMKKVEIQNQQQQ